MLILASGSPRRKELISLLDIPFKIVVSKVNEDLDGSFSPEETVKILSFRKASAVAKDYPDDLVLGVDTVVCIDGRILGKPTDEEDAKRMLRLLSGREHKVFTGFSVVGKFESYSETVCTVVRFAPLDDREIERYVASGEPMDKAGAYGIQGRAAAFVTGIEGDYHTVMGLPVNRIYTVLRDRFKGALR